MSRGRGAGLRSWGALYAKPKSQWELGKALCREEVRLDLGFRKITSVNNNDNNNDNLNLLNAYYVSDIVPSALQGHSLDLNLGHLTSEQMFLIIRCLDGRYRGTGRLLRECG